MKSQIKGPDEKTLFLDASSQKSKRTKINLDLIPRVMKEGARAGRARLLFHGSLCWRCKPLERYKIFCWRPHDHQPIMLYASS